MTPAIAVLANMSADKDQDCFTSSASYFPVKK